MKSNFVYESLLCLHFSISQHFPELNHLSDLLLLQFHLHLLQFHLPLLKKIPLLKVFFVFLRLPPNNAEYLTHLMTAKTFLLSEASLREASLSEASLS